MQRAGLDFGKALLKIIPVAGKAAATAFRIYDSASRSTEVNGEPAEQAFQTRADQVGVELAKRLTAEQKVLTRQLPNTIAGDYEKLRTVGTCASAKPVDWEACPHSDLQFTQDDQEHAAKLLGPQLDIASDAALLPARFTLCRLPPWWRTNVGDNKDFYGVTKVIDTDFWLPFAGLPDSAQVAVPVYFTPTPLSHYPWRDSPTGWCVYGSGAAGGYCS